MFYSGLDLISTYKDSRFRKTISETIEALKNGDNIVIYPELSDKGYLTELEGLHAGFVLLCEQCLKQGIDIPVYVSYFRKDINTYVFDKPVKYSTIKEQYKTRDEILHKLCLLCNELGKMEIPEMPSEEPKDNK